MKLLDNPLDDILKEHTTPTSLSSIHVAAEIGLKGNLIVRGVVTTI
jgi:hypothetical protein